MCLLRFNILDGDSRVGHVSVAPGFHTLDGNPCRIWSSFCDIYLGLGYRIGTRTFDVTSTGHVDVHMRCESFIGTEQPIIDFEDRALG